MMKFTRMPSKKYNGNSPLGGSKIDGFADAELEIAKRSPRQALTTGVIQTPSGAIHTPKRRRKSVSSSASTDFDHPWRCYIASRLIAGELTEGLRVNTSEFADFTQQPPTYDQSYIYGREEFYFAESEEFFSSTIVLLASYDHPDDDISIPKEWIWDNIPVLVSNIENPANQDSMSDYEALTVPTYPIGFVKYSPATETQPSSLTARSLVFTHLGLVAGCIDGEFSKILIPV
jgi:hypothetical protein